MNDRIFIISSDSDSGKDDPNVYQPPPLVKSEKIDYAVEGGMAGPSEAESLAGPSGVGDMAVKKVRDVLVLYIACSQL